MQERAGEPVRSIGVMERRNRLGRRHRLAPSARAADLASVAGDLVGIHSSDPVSVFLAARARLCEPGVGAIERALYDDRSVVRMLGMRRTMFVVPVDLAPVVQAACTRAIAGRERRRTVQFLEQAGISDDASAWLAEVEASAHRALLARGDAATTDLYEDEPRLRERMLLAEGKRYEARITVGTRVMPLLAAEGLAVRGRPRGSWISSQYRWHPIEAWVPGGLDATSTPAAQAELVRRWLASFGPGTADDLRWWTGLTAREVGRALAAIDAAEVRVDGRSTAFVLPDDLEPEPDPDPWVALLPALDSTTMGWAGRDWYLGGHRRALFDTNGNAGPTIWSDGRVVGGWGQRANGEIGLRLLEDVGTEAAVAIAAEADRLREWLGPVRFTPRFRTPLERELAG